MAAPVSATIVPSKTAMEPAVGPGHSVAPTLVPESADDGFVTIAGKRRVELPGSSAISSKKLRPAMIGVRSSSSLSDVAKKVRIKSPFVSRFSTDVTSIKIEKSLNEQLKLTYTRLKT
jgi:hypothetical protein